MAKLKQLADAIQAASHSGKWTEVEKTIEQMTGEDFAAHYEPDQRSLSHPLLSVLGWPAPSHIAELIIKKNPISAAKIGYPGCHSVLHCAAGKMGEESLLKITNLLLPYMSQEVITGSLDPNNNTYPAFLTTLEEKRYYKAAAAIPSNLISIMLKNSSLRADEDHSSLYIRFTKFLKDAVHFYDSQISAHPEEADNYFKKGVILQGMGKNEKAIKCYQKAIQLDPNYADKIEGIELSTLPAPGVVVTDTSVQDDRELMKAKISELTQELSKLLQKTTSLAEEVTFLRGSLKVVEEHKGQASAEPPSYEEEVHVEAPELPASMPPDIVLVGDTDVVYHA